MKKSFRNGESGTYIAFSMADTIKDSGPYIQYTTRKALVKWPGLFDLWSYDSWAKLRYLLPLPGGIFKAISTFRPGNGSKKIYLRLAGYKTEKENLRRC
jgi:hypothetical protein